MKNLTIDDLKAGLRKGIIENRATAVFTGSSLKNKGVQQVLDAVVDYLPSPLDIAAVKGTNPAGEEVERPAEDSAPMSALVFKLLPIHMLVVSPISVCIPARSRQAVWFTTP